MKFFWTSSFQQQQRQQQQQQQKASSAILLASRDTVVELPTEPTPWWEVFLGKEKDNSSNYNDSTSSQAQDIVDVANSILGMITSRSHIVDGTDDDDDNNNKTMEWCMVNKGFIKSLVVVEKKKNSGKEEDDDDENEQHFLDPDSFMWDHQNTMFAKLMEKQT
jgi:hypothetical protein